MTKLCYADTLERLKYVSGGVHIKELVDAISTCGMMRACCTSMTQSSMILQLSRSPPVACFGDSCAAGEDKLFGCKAASVGDNACGREAS